MHAAALLIEFKDHLSRFEVCQSIERPVDKRASIDYGGLNTIVNLKLKVPNHPCGVTISIAQDATFRELKEAASHRSGIPLDVQQCADIIVLFLDMVLNTHSMQYYLAAQLLSWLGVIRLPSTTWASETIVS